MSVRIGAVLVNELGALLRDVRRHAGDPLQIVVVPVAGGHPLFSVIWDGSLGKVSHFRFLGRIDTDAAVAALEEVLRTTAIWET
jgi:hypothetical protein